MNYAYIRVSTKDQNEARQLEALNGIDIDKVFMDKLSGKNMEREQLQELLKVVKKGDTIYIKDFSRISRSTKDLLQLVDDLDEKGVALHSLKERLDTGTDTGRMMMTMFSAINEFERATIQERTREGVAIAKSEGKYKGRQIKPIDGFKREYERYLELKDSSTPLTKTNLAKILGITRMTLDKHINKYDEIYN